MLIGFIYTYLLAVTFVLVKEHYYCTCLWQGYSELVRLAAGPAHSGRASIRVGSYEQAVSSRTESPKLQQR